MPDMIPMMTKPSIQGRFGSEGSRTLSAWRRRYRRRTKYQRECSCWRRCTLVPLHCRLSTSARRRRQREELQPKQVELRYGHWIIDRLRRPTVMLVKGIQCRVGGIMCQQDLGEPPSLSMFVDSRSSIPRGMCKKTTSSKQTTAMHGRLM
jgi:hypothetical protein